MMMYDSEKLINIYSKDLSKLYAWIYSPVHVICVFFSLLLLSKLQLNNLHIYNAREKYNDVIFEILRRSTLKHSNLCIFFWKIWNILIVRWEKEWKNDLKNDVNGAKSFFRKTQFSSFRKMRNTFLAIVSIQRSDIFEDFLAREFWQGMRFE